jgi:hypothetical protein
VVRSAAGRRLGLRELAPGVAVTQRAQRDLLAGLRKAGESPLAEEADGSPRLESRKAVRHPGRPLAGGIAASRPEASVEPAVLVARLRTSPAAGNGSAGAGPTHPPAGLERARNG